jgi:hypothetical protein
VIEFRNLAKLGGENRFGYPRAGVSEARTKVAMTSDLLPRSGWDESQAQSGGSEKRGPRGAGWVIAALYIFSAIVFATWFGPWGDDNRQVADPPQQHQHSIHGTQG